MRPRAAALASDALVEAAATEYLTDGGGALGAVLAGFFAAAGAEPGVLLGPLSVLVAGTGQGARAFDGRLRQPGLGAKRPRGFTDANVPPAARVAAPTAIATAVIAHAYGGGQSLRSMLRPGVAAAERAGVPSRMALLERVAQVGAAALLEAAYRRPLLRVGSPSEGGQLTPTDLDPPSDVDEPAIERLDGGSRWVLSPWLDAIAADGEVAGQGSAIVAVDTLGVFAAASYRRVFEGVWIEELGLFAPPSAVPVMRGVPRVSPGARLPTPAPLGVRFDDAGRQIEVAAEPQARRIDLTLSTRFSLSIRRDPDTRNIATHRG
ncbi:MAG TPA: hypothetical protein VER33_21280 [Polyangiaceae bacterium]|nr:hypothetical protein [Polyangiaceae bacterium]